MERAALFDAVDWIDDKEEWVGKEDSEVQVKIPYLKILKDLQNLS